ncbi:MAG: hypothetical protein CMH52_10855 [Myxococcales bacterium]|nr:hypothetical protein [Myxococcales bacterium]
MTCDICPKSWCVLLLFLVIPATSKGKTRIRLDIETAGRWSHFDPNDGIDNAFSLPRSELGVSAHDPAGLSARCVVFGIRSAPETGYIGIDGERMVYALDVAEGRIHWSNLGLSLGSGLLEHPWIALGNRAWSRRFIRPTIMSEGLSPLLDRSDLAFELRWNSQRIGVEAWGQIASGEGSRFRERNSGKNLLGVVRWRPLVQFSPEYADHLSVAIYGQEGSKGVQNSRSHAYGLRLDGHHRWFRTGAEWNQSIGYAGDPQPEPVAMSTWLIVYPLNQLAVIARLDRRDSDRNTENDLTHTVDLGVSWTLMRGAQKASIDTIYSRSHFQSQAREVAGADVQATARTIFLQLTVQFSLAKEH